MPLPGSFMLVAVIASAAVIVFTPLAVATRRATPRAQVLRNPLMAFGLLGLLALAWVFDQFAALSSNWIFSAAFLIAGLLPALLLGYHHDSRSAVGLGLVFAGSIVLLHVADFTPRKPYRRFFDALQNGMTLTEVRTALRREFPVGGRYREPALYLHQDSMSFLLDPTDGRYNAESIGLQLRDGRVSTKRYSAD